MTRRRRLFWGSLLAVAIATSSAYAQPEPSVGPGYRELAERATRAVAERRLDDALMLFREMHALLPSARTLWSLGRVHYERGEYVTAVEYLSRALDDPRRPLDEAQRRDVSSLRSRALALVDELELRVRPEDATVLVDDIERPGRVVRLDPGAHVLRFEAPGHEPTTRRVVVSGGERRTMSVELTPRAGAGPARDVHLQVGADTPGLRLHLQPLSQGTARAMGPMELVCEAPCAHTLRTGRYAAAVSRDADEAPARALEAIDISADSEARVRYVDRSGARTTMMALGGVLLGLAVAGAASAAVYAAEDGAESGFLVLGFVGGGIGGAVGITLLTFGALIGDGARVDVAPR